MHASDSSPSRKGLARLALLAFILGQTHVHHLNYGIFLLCGVAVAMADAAMGDVVLPSSWCWRRLRECLSSR